MKNLFKNHTFRNVTIVTFVLTLAMSGYFIAKAVAPGPTISIDTINGFEPEFNFVCPTNPLFAPVTITGSGSGYAPPGQVQQYHVQIDWGDGMVTNDLGVFDPPSGNQTAFTYTFEGGPHSYDSDNYTITARLYHQEPPGNDNQADVVASIPVCVVSEPPILTVIKHVINDDIGDWIASNFDLYVKIGGENVFNSPAPGSETGTIYTLAPGTYVVSEDPVSGYAQSISGHCDVDGNITLDSGDYKTCTITNDDIEPECTEDADCDDGLACNGAETCVDNECVQGTPVNCSQYNITAVETCGFDPDSNPFTWDFRDLFNSVCQEPSGTCTIGDDTITHTCSVGDCQAECDAQHPCPDTICEDGCVGNDYYDYDNVANTCLGDCTCTENSCGEPNIYPDDPACTECQTDDDCDAMDDDYCEGTVIMHDEGVCNESFVCEVETTPGLDCDDGLYCNGQETCSNANFRLKATVTDVSGSFYVNHIRVKVYYTVGIPGDTGWKNPTATGDDYNEWTNPTYAYFSDEDRVELSSSGLEQDYYDFDFNIPSGATIDGILVEIEGYEDIVGELGIKLSWNGGANTTSTKYVPFTTSEGYISVGGDTDTWGRTWSDSHFSDANCVGGTPVDCSENDLSEIGTCDFDPDNNIFTWDFFAEFLSECNEETDSCTTGIVDLDHDCDIESCDAECEIDADCDDQNEATTDTCNTETCECNNAPIEQPVCGDGVQEGDEECDDGTQNGTSCNPAYGDTCYYCTFACESVLLTGPYCGDTYRNGDEQCDDGPEGSEYCTSNCTWIETPEHYCGDNVVDEGEECDAGESNGQECSPGCESTCDYCTTNCTTASLTGGSCGGGGGGGGGGGTPSQQQRPTLTIDKSIAELFTNPGSIITYTIVVTNTGPGIAYNATLDDNLPDGFSYDDPATTGEWDLGDIKKDDSTTTTFLARVGDDVAAGTYSSPAETEADNHNPVLDDAGIEIRIPEVLGEVTELPSTNGITSLMTLLWIVALIALMYSGTTLAEIFTGIRV